MAICLSLLWGRIVCFLFVLLSGLPPCGASLAGPHRRTNRKITPALISLILDHSADTRVKAHVSLKRRCQSVFVRGLCACPRAKRVLIRLIGRLRCGAVPRRPSQIGVAVTFNMFELDLPVLSFHFVSPPPHFYSHCSHLPTIPAIVDRASLRTLGWRYP